MAADGLEPQRLEIRNIAERVVPLIEQAPDDLLIIIGDFNLDPNDDGFNALKECGFQHNGDGKYTNMHEVSRAASDPREKKEKRKKKRRVLMLSR